MLGSPKLLSDREMDRVLERFKSYGQQGQMPRSKDINKEP
jgi:hypothetical protein